jgi:signal peptidase I
MNDDSNRDNPFDAPDPGRFEQPRRLDPEPPRVDPDPPRFETAPPRFDADAPHVEPDPPRFDPQPGLFGDRPTYAASDSASPSVHAAHPYPHDPLIGPDPLVTPVSAHDPRLALDGTSLWLNRLGEELVAWLKTLASAAVYATLIVTFGFQVARVEGMSMAPTLQDQDRLIVNKLAYRLSDPKVGDIVMLYYPLKPEKSFVKRIIAEEGDQVRIVDGRVFRNDVPLDDSYVPPDYRSHDDWGPRVIDEGYYFVMGDHRNNSSDSRHWGLVPKKYIIGKVQLRWWPMGHAKVF